MDLREERGVAAYFGSPQIVSPSCFESPQQPYHQCSHVNDLMEKLICCCCHWSAATSDQIRQVWHHRRNDVQSVKIYFFNSQPCPFLDRQMIGEEGQSWTLQRVPLFLSEVSPRRTTVIPVRSAKLQVTTLTLRNHGPCCSSSHFYGLYGE